jgi:DNA polymerase-3 subunit beta
MHLVMSFKAVNLEEPSVTLVPADVLATASKTIFAAGNDDLRPVMSGFFQFSPEGLTFVLLMRTN